MEKDEQGTEEILFKARNHSFHLLVSKNLFMPNVTTKFFAESVDIEKDDIVFEIGAGQGDPLGIWAALEPSKHVYGVEIVKEQYELAKENIKRNNLESKITLYNGSLFEPIPESLKADVIIADVSGISENIARVSNWYPNLIPSGGKNGSEVIVSLINQAGRYLNPKNPKSRLYFPIMVNFCDGDEILNVAEENFLNLEYKPYAFPLLTEQNKMIDLSATKEGINREVGIYSPLKKKGSRYLAEVQIYKASDPFIWSKIPSRTIDHRAYMKKAF